MSCPGRLLVALLASVAMAPRCVATVSIPEEDRLKAAELVERSAEAESNGDDAAATRLLLRAIRWDPSRLVDYRRAVARLEREDPLAAVRHGLALCRLDPTFGVANGSRLVMRLQDHAERIGTLETVPAAAIFARRTAAWGEGAGVLGWRESARLWARIASLHQSVGHTDEASRAFERYQQLVLPNLEEWKGTPPPWRRVTESHLLAERVGPAAVALDALRSVRGEDGGVFLLRSKIALQLDDPLSAANHARRAIESGQPAYAEFIQAMMRINQAGRAADELAQRLADDPDDVALRVSHLDALSGAGRRGDADEALAEFLELALAWSPRFDELADGGVPDEAALAALEVAIDCRLAVAAERGSGMPSFDSIRRWAARLGSTERLLMLLSGVEDLGSESTLPIDWERTLALPARDREPGARRAIAALALLAERHEVAHRALASRLVDASDAGADPERLRSSVLAWITRLGDVRDFDAMQRAIEACLPLVAASTDPAEVTEPGGPAALKVALARALIEQTESGPEEDHQDRVTQLLSEASASAPASWYVAAGVLMNYRRLGRWDDAVTLAETMLDRDPQDAWRDSYRPEMIIDLAETLHARNLPGDRQRACDLLEDALDAKPDDPGVLNTLAYWWTDPGAPLARAERMARRAVELKPESPACLDTLAWVLFHRGELAESERLLRTAVGMLDRGASRSTRDEVRAHHAEVLRRLGQAEAAEASTPR